jgi:DNA-binding beta-propeller fold protein YncE
MKRAIFAQGLLAIAFVVGLDSNAAASARCAPVSGLSLLCGPVDVEDLVLVPGTHWLIGSGMAESGRPGKLHLINADKKTWEVFYPGANPQNKLDTKSYGSCPGPPDSKTFGAHGIAIRDDGNQNATLLSVNHGREAVEVFKLDFSGIKPSIRWIGCVPMPSTVSLNSVAFLPGDGFVATEFYNPKAPEGFRAILERKITGGVLEWHPGDGVKPIAGTDLSGANGIEVSRDGRSLYVAAWGTQELVRFSNINGSLQKNVVKVDFSPDNIRWAPDGTLLVAGQNTTAATKGGIPGFKGWTVAKLDPKTMKLIEIVKDEGESPLQNASVAIDVDGTLWIGVYRGDCIGYKPMK